jgi:hypothetical protein
MGIAKNIQMALKMYSNEYHDKLSFVYPYSSGITNLDSLYTVVSPYIEYNPNSNLSNNFINYEVGRDSELSDTAYDSYPEINRTFFTVTVKAKDKYETLVTVTSTLDPFSVFQGNPVVFP